MMIYVLLLLLAIAAVVTWRTFKRPKVNATFYTWVVIALVAAFLAKKMAPMSQHSHIYIAVSIILGHCMGVFVRTWDEW